MIATVFDFNRVRPIEAVVEGNSREDLERAIKNLNRAFKNDRIKGILKEKSFYEKPSIKKRRKSREAKKRLMMNLVREEMIKTGEWDIRLKKKEANKIRKQERAAEVLDD